MNDDAEFDIGGDQSAAHDPVLPAEIVEYLGGGLGEVVDCTLGLAGHARLLLEHDPTLRLIGMDADESNLEQARQRLADYQDRIRLVRANFADLSGVLSDLGVESVGGILADLGLSSNQIENPDRGFSFDRDGPLDMRIDPTQPTTAADLVNTLSEGELSDLLYFQSQERHSRRIARRICEERRRRRINSTVMLSRLVAAAVGVNPDSHRAKIHPATRTFMALRMAVNQETETLGRLLEAAPEWLRPGGRFAVISFHSIEDRAVKEDHRGRARAGQYRLLTKKPIVAGDEERERNPRSRSAKLRVAERAGSGCV